MKWNKEQIEYIKKNYTNGNIKNIADHFQVSYRCILSIASRYKIKCGHKKYEKLKPLFVDNHISWYWKGFIMADGHLSAKGNLLISSHLQDAEHLQKLCKLLSINHHIRKIKTNYKNSYYCFASCQDSYYGPEILKQLDIKNPKTYNAPDLSRIPDEFLLSFFVGFFDGDGYFPTYKERPNTTKMRIIVHKNWISSLEQLAIKLSRYGFSSIKTSINKRGYAQIIFYGKDAIKNIKELCLMNQIPILKRKWNKV